MSKRLSDEMVAYLAVGHHYPPPRADEVALLAREVQDLRQAERMAMPEMQAIRKALRCWWEHCACNDHPITDHPVDDFPDSVLAWVLDEGSNP